MNNSGATEASNVIAMLRRLSRPKETTERCHFCNLEIAPVHRHLLEIESRKMICVCDPCGLRFENVVGGRFKLIPRDVRILPGFAMTDAQWESLNLPINLTFFFRDSIGKKVAAMYPSPAGATESLLPAGNWAELEAANPALAGLQADVEALLVNRIASARDYFIAPMDVCYELVGLIRMHWRGLSGGEEVGRELEKFFAGLRERALTAAPQKREAVHA